MINYVYSVNIIKKIDIKKCFGKKVEKTLPSSGWLGMAHC
jgi:hypothetical protein